MLRPSGSCDHSVSDHASHLLCKQVQGVVNLTAEIICDLAGTTRIRDRLLTQLFSGDDMETNL